MSCTPASLHFWSNTADVGPFRFVREILYRREKDGFMLFTIVMNKKNVKN